jgi:hypothetical protein
MLQRLTANKQALREQVLLEEQPVTMGGHVSLMQVNFPRATVCDDQAEEWERYFQAWRCACVRQWPTLPPGERLFRAACALAEVLSTLLATDTTTDAELRARYAWGRIEGICDARLPVEVTGE